MKNLLQIIRFGFVGGAATVLHYGIAIVVLMLGMSALQANAIGFLGAFGLGFLGHRHFTFHDRGIHKVRSLARYGVVSLGSFLCGQALLATIMIFYWMPETLALSLVIVFVATLNFVLSRNWAFAAVSKSCSSFD